MYISSLCMFFLPLINILLHSVFLLICIPFFFFLCLLTICIYAFCSPSVNIIILNFLLLLLFFIISSLSLIINYTLFFAAPLLYIIPFPPISPTTLHLPFLLVQFPMAHLFIPFTSLHPTLQFPIVLFGLSLLPLVFTTRPRFFFPLFTSTSLHLPYQIYSSFPHLYSYYNHILFLPLLTIRNLPSSNHILHFYYFFLFLFLSNQGKERHVQALLNLF